MQEASGIIFMVLSCKTAERSWSQNTRSIRLYARFSQSAKISITTRTASLK
jgi:hypothetical protein